jgi:putative membrane protein
MRSPKFQDSVKALLLLALGFFLYTRLAGGTLYFYISQRFAWLTLLAMVGFVIVALSYRFRGDPQETEEHDHHYHGHDHDHAHGHGHSHGLSWPGVLLVALPVILGLAVPPQPLGASALGNREVQIGSVSSAMPAAVQAAAARAATEKNVLDWLLAFQASDDPVAAVAGQEARVIGFVFRDERFAPDSFMLTRFLVSCCVADASAAGLVVQWPQAAELEEDQWVEVRGHFEAGQLDGRPIPVLVAVEVVPTTVPNQPYLYP